MCSEPVMRAPFSGCFAANSSRIAMRPGISVSAILISLRPQSASARSATWKSCFVCGTALMSKLRYERAPLDHRVHRSAEPRRGRSEPRRLQRPSAGAESETSQAVSGVCQGAVPPCSRKKALAPFPVRAPLYPSRRRDPPRLSLAGRLGPVATLLSGPNYRRLPARFGGLQAIAGCLIPASAASAFALSARSHVNSGSSRPKWP